MYTRTLILRFSLILALGSSCCGLAQKSPNVPLISGGGGYFSSTNKGATFMQPVIAPVLAFPLGSHLLLEARGDLRGVYAQKGRTGPYKGSFTAALEYGQLDYVANRHVTLVAGRFLTPFGTYNERLSALWIRNLQDVPLAYGLGTRTSGSSDGLMVRGNAYGTGKVHIDYLGYFSANVTSIARLKAARTAGERIDVYFPGKRIEIGSSYQRFLQGTHYNVVGAHFWWMPWSAPVQVRSEYVHGPHAQGYWMETAYRVVKPGRENTVLGRFMPVFRMQQTFRNSPDSSDGLPSVDTKQADFGFNYNFPHEVRLNTSYSRTFTTVNGNIWDISLTYRFLTPLWRGHKK